MRIYLQLRLLIFCLLAGCMGRSYNVEDLLEIDNIALKKKARTTTNIAPPKKPVVNATITQRCKARVEAMVPTLKRLRAALEHSPDRNNLLVQISELKPSQCEGYEQKRTVDLLLRFLAQNNSKIGVILPKTAERGYLADAVEAGMKKSFARRKINFTSYVLLRDSKDQPKKALRDLADLIFNEQVSLVITGLDQGVAQIVSDNTHGLGIPTLVLHKEASIVKNNPTGFILYPNELDLAESLAGQAKQSGYKKIAVLRPNTGKSDGLIKAFTIALIKHGIAVEQDLPYTPGDYNSMEQVIAAVTHTETKGREEEYEELLRVAEQKAKIERKGFDARMVLLPPQPSVDAVFIPDHFKMLRYFVKLFRYNGVEKFPLLGTHEWRSIELVEPWDDFLRQAHFVDYVGSYKALPAGIEASTAINEYFVPADDVVGIDFQLIGYRSADLAWQVVSDKKIGRGKMTQKLLQMSEPTGYFSTQESFSANRLSRWPTYLFSLRRGGINILARKTCCSSLFATGIKRKAVAKK